MRGPKGGRKHVGAAGTSVLAMVGAALVPKCPLCVAAALTALGLGGAVAQRIAPFVRVGVFAIGGIALALFAFLLWSRRRRRPSPPSLGACRACMSRHA